MASDNNDNIKSQMYKGYIEYCILMIIKSRTTYSLDIINALKEAGLDIVEGTLYPLLTRMKNKNLLSYTWRESQAGPPRKYYKITPEDIASLEELENTWNLLSSALEKLKQSCLENSTENPERFQPNNDQDNERD